MSQMTHTLSLCLVRIRIKSEEDSVLSCQSECTSDTKEIKCDNDFYFLAGVLDEEGRRSATFDIRSVYIISIFPLLSFLWGKIKHCNTICVLYVMN